MNLERKYNFFEEQSEVIPKALYCYPFCFLSTKTVCIINVWGCGEIVPNSLEIHGVPESAYTETEDVLLKLAEAPGCIG